MKTNLLFAAALAASVFSAVPLFAADVEVPDLETRIRNTGASVPANAVPSLSAPAPVPLPSVDATAGVPASTAIPEQKPAVPAPAEKTVPAIPPRAEPSVTGHAAIGAGWPGSMLGDVSLSKSAGDAPGFTLSAVHDSRSLFNRSARGVWSGATELAAAVSAPVSSASPSSAGWSAGVSLRDRSDGLQGINPDYASVSARELSFSGSSGAIPLGQYPLSVIASLSGGGFSSNAEKAGQGAPSVSIGDYGAYAFSPTIGLAFAKESFVASVSGTYSYDSVSQSGETHSGLGSLSLGYRLGGASFVGSVGFLADTADGPLVPFDLSVSWRDDTAFVRRAVLSGGLAADRVSPWSLSKSEPFAMLDGKTVYPADWNARAGLTLAPLSDVALDAGVDWRYSAFGRGTLVVSDVSNAATGWRYAIVRQCRQSIVTTASASVTESFWSATAGYEAELLDRLYRASLHTLKLGGGLRDPSARRLWDASASCSLFFASWQVPDVSLSGSLHPYPGMTLSAGFTDGVPLVTGVARKLNGLYSSAAGAVTVSARIDF